MATRTLENVTVSDAYLALMADVPFVGSLCRVGPRQLFVSS